MKRMSINNYQETMGPLIDLSNPEDFIIHHDKRAKNIPFQQFILHYPEYLNKDTPYYLVCRKGLHSSKAVSMLEYFGYNVTQVVYN